MRKLIEDRIQFLEEEGKAMRGVTSGDSDYLFFLGMEDSQAREIEFLHTLLALLSS